MKIVNSKKKSHGTTRWAQLAVLAAIAVTVLFHWTMPVGTVINVHTPLLLPPEAHKQRQDSAVRNVALPVVSVTKTLLDAAKVVITDPQVHATVMGIATNYDMKTHQRFIGSLRYSGYRGQIILGLEPVVKDDRIVPYLISQNVTIKYLSYVPCNSFKEAVLQSNDGDQNCAHPYPDLKIRWSRFPLWRDWLQECTVCTGPVLVTDVRDVVFQRNPFSSEYASNVRGLQLFEDPLEHVSVSYWFVGWPILSCKNVTYEGPMFCSGTVVGTRKTMIHYLNLMEQEMRLWSTDPNCRFDLKGDDQAVHNYLYYSGQLPDATKIPFREPGSMVVTMAVEADLLFGKHSKPNENGAVLRPYPGSTQTKWIGMEFNLTDENGFVVDADGTTITPVLHQYDRFGPYYEKWLDQQPWSGLTTVVH